MKKIKLLMPMLCLTTLTSLAVTTVSCGGENEEEEEGQQVNVVIPEITGLEIENPIANTGKDFSTTISINTELTKTGLVLPKTKESIIIKSASQIITDGCEYDVDESDYLSAKLTIPGNLITDNITLDFELYNPDPGESITEEEFTKALAFTDEEYVQVNQTHLNEVGGENTSHVKMSPSISYGEWTMNFPRIHVHTYEEQFIKKISDQNYEGLERKDEEATEYTAMDPLTAEINFVTSEWIVGWLFQPDSYYKFDKYTYNSTAKIWSYTYEEGGGPGHDYTIELEFCNKKLINLKHYFNIAPTRMLMTNVDFDYVQKTPDWPVNNF